MAGPESGETEIRYDWRRLNHLQVGRFAQYYVKMEFTLYGFDVYSAEVDDKGIDFVIRRGVDAYYDVQVKSIRDRGYVFFPKAIYSPRANLYAAVVVLAQGRRPDTYLIPSQAWNDLDDLLVSRDYEGLRSKPEWGLNLSAKNQTLLNRFRFSSVATKLIESAAAF